VYLEFPTRELAEDRVLCRRFLEREGEFRGQGEECRETDLVGEFRCRV